MASLPIVLPKISMVLAGYRLGGGYFLLKVGPTHSWYSACQLTDHCAT
jgi:hypothetical protein